MGKCTRPILPTARGDSWAYKPFLPRPLLPRVSRRFSTRRATHPTPTAPQEMVFAVNAQTHDHGKGGKGKGGDGKGMGGGRGPPPKDKPNDYGGPPSTMPNGKGGANAWAPPADIPKRPGTPTTPTRPNHPGATPIPQSSGAMPSRPFSGNVNNDGKGGKGKGGKGKGANSGVCFTCHLQGREWNHNFWECEHHQKFLEWKTKMEKGGVAST